MKAAALLSLLLLLIAAPAWAVSAALVQHVSVGGQSCCGSVTGTTLDMRLPEPAQAGNFLMLHIYTNNSTPLNGTTSCGDDINGAASWTNQINGNAGANVNFYVFYRKNTTGSEQKISCVFTGSNNSFVAYDITEWFNVDQTNPVHCSASNDAAASTTWAAGTLCSLTSGDVVYATGDTGAATFQGTSAYSASTGFTMKANHEFEGFASEFGTSTGGTDHQSPSFTSPVSTAYAAMSVALTGASAGSDNSNVPRIKNASLYSYNGSTVAANNYAFPCQGTLEVMAGSISANAATKVSTLTSSSVSYTDINNSTSKNIGVVQMMHADNFSCSATNHGTITFDAALIASDGASLWFLDVVGAATSSPLDTTTVVSHGGGNIGTTSGSVGDAQNGATSTTTPFKFGGLAGNTTELCIHYWDHNSGSDTGTSTTGAHFFLPYFGGDGQAGNMWTMDSGGLSIRITNNTATQLTYTRSATASSNFQSLGGCFQQPAVAAGAPKFIMERLQNLTPLTGPGNPI